MIDIDNVRADTPACHHLIHFNNAGASLMPLPVYDAMTSHLKLEQTIGGYEAENSAAQELDDFYSEYAALLNASPKEIAYVENATRAWDMAFYGLPLKSGDRILTHESEYASNYLAYLQQKLNKGWEVDVVPSDNVGQIDLSAMEAMITPRTRLIAITHVPTQGGLINPVEGVGKIAKKHDLIYMLDACQAVGQIALDVKKIGCHILSGTGRKYLRGPRGTGFLYVCDDMLQKIEPPFIDLRSATWTNPDQFELARTAKRYENWESNVAGKIGLMQAVRYARQIGLDNIETRVVKLAKTLRQALGDLPDIAVHDLGVNKCGIVTFSKAGKEPKEMASYLRHQNINVSVSNLSSAQLDFGKRNLRSLVRASVHYFNTENEVDRFLEVIKGY
ncbi:MAG: aminotransferase class V-fold PLP-dependent enzyme [Pseudomonadales bacterium]|nr:aminotransferase class V-fold PLP-dependent enzyme [Pseudomonadales bacterium]